MRSYRFVAALAGLLAGVAPHAGSAQDTAASHYGRCLACHAPAAGTEGRTAPYLGGMIGRRAGSIEGFAYSNALEQAGANGIVWTEETLDRYLADPAGFLPGSRMAWAVSDKDARAAIIAHLKTLP